MPNVIINYTGRFGSALTQELHMDAKELYMWNMGVTSIDLAPLTKCTQLQRIVLSQNNLKRIDLTPLSQCINLNHLSIANNDIKEVDISPLFFCPYLGEVELGSDTLPIADSRLKSLLPHRAGLKYMVARMGREIRWRDGILAAELLSRLEQRKTSQFEPEEIPIREDLKGMDAKTKTVAAETPVSSKDFKVLRGGEIVGGKFEYKVKIQNGTDYVINNVTVTVVAYPQDCMEISEGIMKVISRIEPAGFRSPQFTFTPTKDCVEGQLLATVSYVDHENKLQMRSVEPYIIRSVCDLLKPLEKPPEVFEKFIIDKDSTSEKLNLDWNPQVIFTKTQKLLPLRNFYIIDANGKTIGGEFTGTVRGFAEGKYTGKKVAVQALISGPSNGNQTSVIVEGIGEDAAMLPTTILELSSGISSWICMNCGASLKPDEVVLLKSKAPLQCAYCKHTLTIDLYRQ